ncbi:hypothetical protein IP84_04535 [beta proteobacterium AAP99]|nr:hypothetical protein IP84_04535 [beta proteobacterium AAP99]
MPERRSMPEPATVGQVLAFIGVGAAAAATHFGVVLALVGQLAWPPLIANVFGFACAFCVSFLGHWRLTFAEADAPLARSLRRFFLVALAAFTLNEALYALLLLLQFDYRFALAFVLLTVALITFRLARRWAFVAS